MVQRVLLVVFSVFFLPFMVLVPGLGVFLGAGVLGMFLGICDVLDEV